MFGKNFFDHEKIAIHIMGWLSKIFKGSGHRLSEGHNHGRHGDDPNSYAFPSSRDIWSEHQNEDIDHAIALSLAEENRRGNNVVDNGTQLEEDEQLARAIQESLNVESPPRYRNVNVHQPVPFHLPTGFRICAGCKAEIGHGQYLSCMNAVWHPQCFRCHACNLPISDYEFSLSGNNPYHQSCYKEHYHPKCDVCKHFIPTNPAGLIEYRAHPFWIQKYCPSHECDGTPRCCSCERMEGHYHMPETRGLCLSEEQTVSSILRRPQIGAGNRMAMITEPNKLKRHCEVADWVYPSS